MKEKKGNPMSIRTANKGSDRERYPCLEELVSPYIFDHCIGKIHSVEPEQNRVWVDFPGNPFGKPVAAKLGRSFSINDLNTAIDEGLEARLVFEDNNPEKPVVRDIYYSILSERPHTEMKDIIIKGRRIVIQAETEIVIRSGEASVTCTADGGKMVAKGENITSEALQNNKIKGAAVAIN